MKPLKIKVSITLDSDLVEQIKSLAGEDDRGFSQFINRVLKQYVEENLQAAPGNSKVGKR